MTGLYVDNLQKLEQTFTSLMSHGKTFIIANVY